MRHCGIPLPPAITLRGFDQLVDFAFGQVLARSKLGIRPP
jgi:hypothetical protein